MLQDGISLLDSSVIENFQIQNGTSLPSTGLNLGELFYLTSGDVGLYIYNGTEWVKSTGSGAVYTAGSGIAISGSNVISSTVSAAGNTYQVQMSDGSGGFAAIPAPSAENLVLTSHVGATPTWEVPQVSGGIGDMAIFVSGIPTANQLLFKMAIARAVTIPAGATLSQAVAGTAATASYTLSLNKNGVSFGTVNFAASSAVGTFTVASSTTFAAGDVISVVAASTPDTTLADVAITLAVA